MKGWKIFLIVVVAILVTASIILGILAGVKSGQEDIGFFEALGQLLGIVKAEPEVIPGEEIVEAIKTIA